MTNKYLSFVIKVLVLLLWAPALVFAGIIAAAPDSQEILNVPMVVLMVNLVIATLAGGTTLAIRINAQLMNAPDKPLPRPGLFCTAHMLGSWLSGTFFFLLSQHQQTGVWLGFSIVLLGSFSGAKALELAVEKYLPMGRMP